LQSDNRPPYYLAEDLHRVREVGNVAAYPIKDEATEAILEVEPGEAEWLLDLVGSYSTSTSSVLQSHRRSGSAAGQEAGEERPGVASGSRGGRRVNPLLRVRE
jgi:hypothetical protein